MSTPSIVGASIRCSSLALSMPAPFWSWSYLPLAQFLQEYIETTNVWIHMIYDITFFILIQQYSTVNRPNVFHIYCMFVLHKLSLIYIKLLGCKIYHQGLHIQNTLPVCLAILRWSCSLNWETSWQCCCIKSWDSIPSVGSAYLGYKLIPVKAKARFI